MRFNVTKTKCVTFGKELLKHEPKFYLNGTVIESDTTVEILGVTFNSNGNYDTHIHKRINACRRNMYRLSVAGMSYPGLATDAKPYLWNSIGAPTLLYGLDSVPLSRNQINNLKSVQGCTIKRVMGISKKSHHTNLMDAMGVVNPETIIANNTIGLYRRIMQVDTPARSLQIRALANYMLTGSVIPGTLLHRLLNLGRSPIYLLFNSGCDKIRPGVSNSGVVDSLRYLIHHENFIKPWADEHILASLLTRAF